MRQSNVCIGNMVLKQCKIVCKLLIGLSWGTIFLLAGCLNKNENTLNPGDHVLAIESADILYKQALANLNAGRFEEAVKKFSAIEKTYAYTEWGRKALIKGASVNHQLAKYDDAINMAQRYITLYPTSDDSDYAYYIIGLSSFKQIPDVTRDQKDTKRAIAAMQLLVERYPGSKYVKDAKAKIHFAREQLAGKEMQIGRYYERGRQYLAASKRFRKVIEEYSDTNQVEEALFRLTEVNLALGLIREAQTAVSILKRNYPASQWYKLAYNLLQKSSILPQEHKSSWISNAFSNN
ncbi:outer membrane protein assembly factor BamD [Bartonella sp. A05]|uniref:outer membrane protein assembly factor BamD n=1 Tax=Bartonella sp. A05 TaxID=2967261 RepID=UPI0022A984A3|nr:outer membrane protein assembly factor BamD [Bartonella sp. A05]MCZ2204054.1 outer membrane protein assembly factor BamD [Bartonella sp. A05]